MIFEVDENENLYKMTFINKPGYQFFVHVLRSGMDKLNWHNNKISPKSKQLVAKNYPDWGFMIAENDDEPLGRAVLIRKDGSRYDGFWPMDQNCLTYGRLIKTNGYVYEGTYFANNCHGYGKYTTLDGESYIGNFVQNQKDGYGKLTLPSGEVYTGYFKHNMRNG